MWEAWCKKGGGLAIRNGAGGVIGWWDASEEWAAAVTGLWTVGGMRWYDCGRIGVR